MKILTALTYYRPHISGLTIYAERVCRCAGPVFLFRLLEKLPGAGD
jgi:hypothetical protein